MNIVGCGIVVTLTRLLDDFQIEDLDERVGLKPESQVVFLYLTPLKGG